MIELCDWATYSVADIDLDSYPEKYSVGFTLNDNFDQRTDWSKGFISKVCDNVICIEYLPNEAQLNIDQTIYSIRELNDFEFPEGRVLVDATSLALPELLHLFSILNTKKKAFDVAYIQPATYKEQNKKSFEGSASFDLSDDGLGIQQLPPFVGSSTNSRILFFLGWEGHRLGALINSEEFNVKNVTCLAGIPSYEVGWENTTLECNYLNFKELHSFSPRFKFSGANDPIRTYEIIHDVYESAAYEKFSLSIAALGTKPAAIAAAQFAVNFTEIKKDQSKELIMLYDFVKIKRDRSHGASVMHIWSFDTSGEM